MTVSARLLLKYEEPAVDADERSASYIAQVTQPTVSVGTDASRSTGDSKMSKKYKNYLNHPNTSK